MTPLPTKQEIEAAKERCDKASILAGHTEKQGPVLYRLRYESFPYAYLPKAKDQYLTVRVDQFGNFAIWDLGGFLTFVETPDELVKILRDERENPGALREMITGKNNIREAREREEKHRKELSHNYSTRNRRHADNINLDDLELTI